jgi:radical SAM protein with 4Fe4S-binding SPASM domain
MNLTDFENTVKQAAPLAEEICLHLMGEPLAHPDFEKIITICEKYETQVQITTNGLLLKRYKDLLIHNKFIRQVNFSLQAFKDNFPDRHLDQYLLPILEFVKYSQDTRPELYINFRMWNQQSQQQDNSDIFEYIEKYFNIQINRNIEVGAIKSKRIWNRLYLHFDSRFEWPSLDATYQGKQGRCNGVLKHIGIHANGIVVPCCLDDKATIQLGNCFDEPLENILKNERTTAMREGFLNGVLVEELCQRCSFIKRFSK